MITIIAVCRHHYVEGFVHNVGVLFTLDVVDRLNLGMVESI